MTCPGSRCACADVPFAQLPLGVVMMLAAFVVIAFGLRYIERYRYPPESLFIFWCAGALFLYGFAFALTRLFCTTV